MNKRIYSFLTIIFVLMFSVSCSKKLAPLSSDYFVCNPNPLEVAGGKVEATISGVIPKKYFNKNATLTITPMLQSKGETLKSVPIVLQGEEVLSNNPIVSYTNGANISIPASFVYSAEMQKSNLFLAFEGEVKNKKFQLPMIEVADGVLTTSQLVSISVDEIPPAVAPNSFQRIVQEEQEADILFLIQQAQLRQSELDKESVREFGKKIMEARFIENKSIKRVEILGYASPDGGLELNRELAEKRQKTTREYVKKELKKMNADLLVESKFTAEDWDGFQKLLENSDLQDKKLILRVLSMYDDPEQREQEIKNLLATFSDLSSEILPKLRRSRLKLFVDVTGKSDSEIRIASIKKANSLTAEELLYAGTLMQSDRFKSKIYSKFIDRFPDDARGYINLGIVKYELDEIKAAERLFKKSLKIAPNDPNANFNMGLLALKEGNITLAEEYFGHSAESTGNLNLALGVASIAKGDYQKAEKLLKKNHSNNSALAQILNKNYSKAQRTLNRIGKKDALTSYLLAVIASRTFQKEDVYKYLNEVAGKDKILLRRATRDIEFSKYFLDKEFDDIIKKSLQF